MLCGKTKRIPVIFGVRHFDSYGRIDTQGFPFLGKSTALIVAVTLMNPGTFDSTATWGANLMLALRFL